MKDIPNLAGAHYSLSQAAHIGEFDTWLKENENASLEDYVTGYKILIRATLRVFQDQMHHHLNTLHIDSNLEYERGHAQIADIDTLNADCEASNLVKYLDNYDQDIHSGYDFDTLSDSLATLREDVVKPFDSFLMKKGKSKSNLNEPECFQFLALFSLITFGNDTTRGYPEAYQLGWIKNRCSRNDFEAGFEGYKLALFWIYSKMSHEDTDLQMLRKNVIGAGDWRELDSSFHTSRELLLHPFEKRATNGRKEVFQIDDSDTPNEIAHLLSDAPNPAVGIEKSLNRLFLWDSANKADDVIFGSGSAGFLTLLLGIQNIRQRLETETPIQIRRLKHPDKPGYNYSYAIELAGWALNGTGTLHGWAIFVHMATDYSGFGGSQYDITEEYLESLAEDDVVSIQEIEVSEEKLEEYLSEKGTRSTHISSTEQEAIYDNRRLTDILREGEDQRTEFKSQAPNSGRDIGKEISALTNHRGGVLIFGVDDDGEIVGVEDVEGLDNRVSGVLRKSLMPPLSAEIHMETIRGKDLLIVDIPTADRPVAINYVYYGRNGTNSRKLTYPELKKRYE